MTTIYYNPRCGKCRIALDALQKKECDLQIIEYFKTPPTYAELNDIIKKLKISPYQLLRTKEDVFKEKYKDLPIEETDWISIMLQHPELIQRPIVINGDSAMIVRDEETLNKL